jgi:hypothetical protein
LENGALAMRSCFLLLWLSMSLRAVGQEPVVPRAELDFGSEIYNGRALAWKGRKLSEIIPVASVKRIVRTSGDNFEGSYKEISKLESSFRQGHGRFTFDRAGIQDNVGIRKMKRLFFYLIPLVLVVSASVVCHAQTPSISTPVEKAGVQVTIQPSKATFAVGERLILKVTYLNVSNNPVRLWNAVDPAPYGLWTLIAEDLKTGKRFTGASFLPGGAAPDASRVHPATLLPGKPQSTTVTFENFGFAEGAMSNSAVRTALFDLQAALTRGVENQLSAGSYRISVEIRRYQFANNPGEQSRYDKTIAGGDPTPIWNVSEILSNPVEINIVN